MNIKNKMKELLKNEMKKNKMDDINIDTSFIEKNKVKFKEFSISIGITCLLILTTGISNILLSKGLIEYSSISIIYLLTTIGSIAFVNANNDLKSKEKNSIKIDYLIRKNQIKEYDDILNIVNNNINNKLYVDDYRTIVELKSDIKYEEEGLEKYKKNFDDIIKFKTLKNQKQKLILSKENIFSLILILLPSVCLINNPLELMIILSLTISLGYNIYKSTKEKINLINSYDVLSKKIDPFVDYMRYTKVLVAAIEQYTCDKSLEEIEQVKENNYYLNDKKENKIYDNNLLQEDNFLEVNKSKILKLK